MYGLRYLDAYGEISVQTDGSISVSSTADIDMPSEVVGVIEKIDQYDDLELLAWTAYACSRVDTITNALVIRVVRVMTGTKYRDEQIIQAIKDLKQ